LPIVEQPGTICFDMPFEYEIPMEEGANATVDSVEIHWPSGIVQTIKTSPQTGLWW
jgi:hypothetical protein